ncbi:MAG TPA: tetratricopeptide repeat protein [Kofleriaceae bacterium]
MLAAPAGDVRQQHVTRWLDQAKQHGHSVWMLPCDRRLTGPWAGLIELFGDLVPRLQSVAPRLLVQHDYELAIVLPTLQRMIEVRNPTLTDVSSETERTRNYPLDRGYRIVHGLIDLLAEAQRVLGDPGYALACNDIDHAGALVRMFVSELVRRRGDRLGLKLLVTCDPVSLETVTGQFQALDVGVRIDAAAAPPPAPAPHEMARRAEELERQAQKDHFERQFLLPQLIHTWLSSDQPARALPYQIEALSVYNTRGLYEDALFFGEPALEALERYTPDALMDRMNICVKLYSSYLGMKRPHDAQRIAESAISHTDTPKLLGQWRYMTAMLNARFLPQRNFDQAERDLEQGLVELEQSDLPHRTKAFLTSFNRNGLALVRYLQGRAEDAIALCQWGYAHLEAQLDGREQKLHRTVLVYNIAQVYSTMGNLEEAIRYLTEAMRDDPNYSEYYNERGSIYLKLERYQDAIVDYLRAIELSPPYMEVWTNLGQCYKAVGLLSQAVSAYSRALDLDPRAALALIGRAQAHDGLGDRAAALADYDAVLALDPRQPLVLMNRGALHYENGALQQALDDLDQAIALAPDMPELYENRAVALRALGRAELADGDHATAARLAVA